MSPPCDSLPPPSVAASLCVDRLSANAKPTPASLWAWAMTRRHVTRSAWELATRYRSFWLFFTTKPLPISASCSGSNTTSRLASGNLRRAEYLWENAAREAYTSMSENRKKRYVLSFPVPPEHTFTRSPSCNRRRDGSASRSRRSLVVNRFAA